VSKHLRGRVWTLLHEQWKLRHSDERKSPSNLLDLPYDELLKSLTPHQHAILIDLGKHDSRINTLQLRCCRLAERFS